MTRHEIDRDLRIEQEGSNVRAVAGRLDILLPKSKRADILKAYNEWRQKVMAYFEPRFQKYAGTTVDESVLRDIVREVTLHWMGYCVMHREPIQMGEAEWSHPQTRRIIRAAVERALPGDSDAARALCAQLLGISRDAYQKWMEADDTFLGIM